MIEDTKHRHVWERKGVEDKTDFYLPVLNIFSFNVSSRPFRKCLWCSWTILRDLEKLLHKPTNSLFIVFWCQKVIVGKKPRKWWLYHVFIIAKA